MSTALSSAASLGLAVLRLTPLAISTASLMFAFDQQAAFLAFLAPPLLEREGHPSAHVVVEWWPAFARPMKWVIILAYPLACTFAIINCLGAAGAGVDPQTKALYWTGGLFSIGHFYFGARSMSWNAKICSKTKIGQRNEDALRSWCVNNWWRTALVNIPAWLCFVTATATFIRV